MILHFYVRWYFALKGQCHEIFCFRFFPWFIFFLLGDIRKLRYPTGINNTGGKFAEVGGPQITSANRKSANLRAYKICYICEPSASVAFVDLRFADPIFCALWTFYCRLILPQICKFFIFYKYIAQKKFWNSAKQTCSRLLTKMFHSLCLMVEKLRICI